jgi:prepilin signal peptidase PulO-like enzyme (type II secretory pathway)
VVGQTITTAVLALLLVYASFIDIRHRLIPDAAIVGLMILGIWHSLSLGLQNWPDLLAATGIVLAIYAVTEVIWRWRAVDVLGLGDIKLMLGIGWVVGLWGLWVTVLSASLGGITWKLVRRVTRKESLETPLPFGPFLGMGCFLAHVLQLLG